MGENGTGHVPVTYDSCARIEGPFYHGTRSALAVGDELVPGYGSNFQEGRVMNHIYFTALVDTAAWGAELASALAGSEERGRIYVVEPLGPFEDDPNVTDKRFAATPRSPTARAIRCASSLRWTAGRAMTPRCSRGCSITWRSCGSRAWT
jgi:rifampin ADP-ribosylating transferase